MRKGIVIFSSYLLLMVVVYVWSGLEGNPSIFYNWWLLITFLYIIGLVIAGVFKVISWLKNHYR